MEHFFLVQSAVRVLHFLSVFIEHFLLDSHFVPVWHVESTLQLPESAFAEKLKVSDVAMNSNSFFMIFVF